MMQRYIVNTVAGNSLLYEDNEVLVFISPGHGVNKKVSQLTSADIVLYKNEYIDKTLEEIEPLLKESSRYKLSELLLHKETERGKTTALAYYLRRGFAKRGISDEEKMAITIKEMLNEYSPKIPKETTTLDSIKEWFFKIFFKKPYKISAETITLPAIKKWLNGEVILPRDKSMLQTLSELDSWFLDAYNSFSSPYPHYPLYNIYVGVRRGVMRYLSRGKGKGEGNKIDEESLYESITLAPEIDIIVSKLFQEIDDTTIAAKVMDVKPIVEEEQEKLLKNKHAKLSKGIVVIKDPKDAEEYGLKISSVQDRTQDFQNLESVLKDIEHGSVKDHYFDEENIPMFISRSAADEFVNYLMSEFGSGACKKMYSSLVINDMKSRVEYETESKYKSKEIITKIAEEHLDRMQISKAIYEVFLYHWEELPHKDRYVQYRNLVFTINNLFNSLPTQIQNLIEFEKSVFYEKRGKLRFKMQQKLNKMAGSLKNSGFDYYNLKFDEMGKRNITKEDRIMALEKYGLSRIKDEVLPTIKINTEESNKFLEKHGFKLKVEQNI